MLKNNSETLAFINFIMECKGHGSLCFAYGSKNKTTGRCSSCGWEAGPVKKTGNYTCALCFGSWVLAQGYSPCQRPAAIMAFEKALAMKDQVARLDNHMQLQLTSASSLAYPGPAPPAPSDSINQQLILIAQCIDGVSEKNRQPASQHK